MTGIDSVIDNRSQQRRSCLGFGGQGWSRRRGTRVVSPPGDKARQTREELHAERGSGRAPGQRARRANGGAWLR